MSSSKTTSFRSFREDIRAGNISVTVTEHPYTGDKLVSCSLGRLDVTRKEQDAMFEIGERYGQLFRDVYDIIKSYEGQESLVRIDELLTDTVAADPELTKNELFELVDSIGALSERINMCFDEYKVVPPSEIENGPDPFPAFTRAFVVNPEEKDIGSPTEEEIRTYVEKQTGITITDESVSWDNLESDYVADKYATIFGVLIDGGYITPDKLPIESSKTRHVISDSESHQNDEEMYRGRKVRPGYWVECHNETPRKEEYLRKVISEIAEE